MLSGAHKQIKVKAKVYAPRSISSFDFVRPCHAERRAHYINVKGNTFAPRSISSFLIDIAEILHCAACEYLPATEHVLAGGSVQNDNVFRWATKLKT